MLEKLVLGISGQDHAISQGKGKNKKKQAKVVVDGQHAPRPAPPFEPSFLLLLPWLTSQCLATSVASDCILYHMDILSGQESREWG